MGKKKFSTMQIIGLVLLAAGAVVLILGVYNLISFNTSTGGKIGNSFAKLAGKPAEAVRNAVIMMIIGAASAACGFFVYKKK